MGDLLQQMGALLPSLKKQYEWGTYFMGKFYFTIATGKKRSEAGLADGRSQLSPESQLRLQMENFPALYHEYIHYLHEMSTVIGNAGLAVDLSQKSIFTHWLDTNPKKAVSNGYTDDELGKKFAKAIATQGVLMGDVNNVLNGKFIQVVSIDFVEQQVYFPLNTDFVEGKLSIPKVMFSEFVGNKIQTNTLMFGKYFLYEGLAYELDRIIDMNVRLLDSINDNEKGTEYIVLRRVAQFIFPDVEKETFLRIGCMSLQYVDCGATFIQMIERVRDKNMEGIPQQTTVAQIRLETSELLQSKRQDFRDAQDEYKLIFHKRKMLTHAFDYLTEKMKKLYDERIDNPTFEIDLVLGRNLPELLDKINVCDYMYLFNDKTDYMRDFLGTSIDAETSMSLKALLSYDDFCKVHSFKPTVNVELTEHNCPFYRCCDLELRRSHADICRSRPWRIYEISANSDNQYCWYGQGVLETKGVNER